MITFVRKNFFNRRFLRFGIVGVAGVFGVKPIMVLLEIELWGT